MLNRLNYTLPETLENAVNEELGRWRNDNKIRRVWNKDASVWTGDNEDRWLGWLNIVEQELNDIQKYADFAKDLENADFESVVLLGMGGSSLCSETLSFTFDKRRFHILDSTVPAQIKTLENKIDISNTLFIVASKSGSTLETNIFKQYFYKKVSLEIGFENAGRHFVAITDPNSKLQSIAEKERFRYTFFGEPTVGGRFSALSVFGMIPATAMGLDAENLLERSIEMVYACKSNLPEENPGVLLGTIFGVCHKHGREKLTVFISPEIHNFGAWLEQLIAESTGKKNISIILIDREKAQNAEKYGEDRVFVYLKLSGASDADLDLQMSSVEENGHPLVRIEMHGKRNLGQEFFRWEFATAVAGSIMGINPFNQPDVETAKTEARKITEAYEEKRSLPQEEAFYEEHGIKLFTNSANLAELDRLVSSDKSLKNYLKAHFSRIVKNDYFALLAYVEMNSENEILLQDIRHKALDSHQAATCLGFGPRFLHSTGQAYKGGANNGLFLQITSEDVEDLAIPEQEYTFGVVKSAQARGDFQVLLNRKRRALRIHLSANVKEDLKIIYGLL